MKTVEERFWEKVDIKGGNECWNWTGHKSEKGYGMLYVDRKRRIRAHRYSWMIHHGMVPEGLYICHKCDNPRCINPNHLFLGTAKDNMEDATQKGRVRFVHCDQRGERNSMAKLTMDKVNEIRNLYANGAKPIELANKFNVCRTCIDKIVHLERWLE